MKQVLFIIFLVFSSFKLQAHNYYFAFAEMELNYSTNKLEITFIINNHDIDHWLEKSKYSLIDFENSTIHDSINTFISNKIKYGFNLNSNNKNISIKLIGFDIKSDGNIEFYYESEVIPSNTNQIEVSFNLLMDLYPDQQNKLIFLKEDSKESFVFVKKETKHLISLKK